MVGANGIGHGRPDTSVRPDLSSPKIMPRFERSGIAHDSVGQQRAQIINPLGRGASAGYRASGVWSLHKGTPARVSGSGTNFLLNRAS
jgi:hypothetical protein